MIVASRVFRARRASQRFVRVHVVVTLTLWAIGVATSESLSAAQQGGTPPRPQRQAPRQFNLPGAPDPPAPEAPEVIVRGENGRVVVRATKL